MQYTEGDTHASLLHFLTIGTLPSQSIRIRLVQSVQLASLPSAELVALRHLFERDPVYGSLGEILNLHWVMSQKNVPGRLDDVVSGPPPIL